MGITEACSRLIGDFLQAYFKPQSSISSPPTCKPLNKLDDSMVRALVTVFGMQNNGRIKKENARQVVEKLGLMHNDYVDDEEEDEVGVEEVLGELEEEDMSKRNELLHEAFKIFDEDGDGYIDAMELKRVLDCLGLDRGWDITTIQNMVKVADLNLDGKVDFAEFQFMMG